MDYLAASDFLSQIDDDWAALIKTVGACTLAPKLSQSPYEALINAVAYQQLHAKAGDAIMQRFLAHYADTFPTPAALIATEFEVLRSCGFSARKIDTLKGLAEGALTGLIPSRSEAQVMEDAVLIERLVSLKGVGRWTVEMMLMFTMARLDVLPADDFGVVHGYKRLKNLAQAPTAKEMREIAKAWQPYRTVASWYLWRVPK